MYLYYKSNYDLYFYDTGAGVAFGPNVVKQFLENNKLQMIVRSHECVRSGKNKSDSLY